MYYNGKKLKGVTLKAPTMEELDAKLTKEDHLEFLALLEKQDRLIEQWNKEHNF